MKSEDPIAPVSSAHSNIHSCYFCRTPIPKRPGKIQTPCPTCPERVIYVENGYPYNLVTLQFQHRELPWELVIYLNKETTYIYANEERVGRLPFLIPDLSTTNVRDKVDLFLTLS